MNSGIQQILVRAAAKILRPVLKLWLRYGLSYQAFEETARWLMVDIAVKDFPLSGRKQTDSRVSVITGLTRHQVKHYRSIELEASPVQAKANRATRVLTGWISLVDYIEADGSPKELDIEHDEISFKTLCEATAGDVPFRSILDELKSLKCVEEGRTTVKLISRGFVPEDDDGATLEIIGDDASHLLNTLEHNLTAPKGRKWYQKKVSYGKLPLSVIREERLLQGEKAQALLEEYNEALAKIQSEGKGKREPRTRAGWGIYYFEQDEP